MEPRRVIAPPEVVADIAAARAEYERGEGRALTPEELRRWVEAGELPADLEPPTLAGMARNRVIDTGAMREIHYHVEALDSLSRARTFPGVDDDAAKAMHKLLIADLNDALRAALAPPPAPAPETVLAYRERPADLRTRAILPDEIDEDPPSDSGSEKVSTSPPATTE